jgi:integrase
VKAGLRAIEIAGLQWRHLTDVEGNLADAITITDEVAKGNKGGRVVAMNKHLKCALTDLQALKMRDLSDPVFYSERKRGNVASQTIIDWFSSLYEKLGFEGASSHSGRRTFITNAAKKITTVGGSLRDVQNLAGHASLQTTQRYIESDEEAKRKIVDLV